MRAEEWGDDPKHLGFVLARYKFVSKMLEGYGKVLEVGAADGIASEVVRRAVGKLLCIDLVPSGMVESHDILSEPLRGFDAAYALDVIEHIKRKDAHRFLQNMAKSVRPFKGVVIIGSPSLESQRYASPGSKAEHVNCMTAKELRAAMLKHFYPVFMFGMNDEVIHCGFDQMRHYNFAIGVR